MVRFLEVGRWRFPGHTHEGGHEHSYGWLGDEEDCLVALAAQDKYSVQVPNGLQFSEFKGYEEWQTVAVSHPDDKINVIVGNPAMIKAFRAGIPGNGKPFPDGAKLAKIAWNPKST